MTSPPKAGRIALGVLPVVIVMVAFFAAIPWLKTLEDSLVLMIAATVAIVVMGYGAFLTVISQRGLDEVQKASSRFAAQWGAAAGTLACGVLVVLPPTQALLHALVERLEGEPVDPSAVALASCFMFAAVVLLQSIGTVVAAAIWWARNR